MKRVFKKIALLFFFLPFVVNAQESTGVNFERGLSWKDIQVKAERLHRYIFLDCYATWCGPCKSMDRDVYPDPEVGKFLNDFFISVKVQIDETPNDNDEIKKWRADAALIRSQYKIDALPTFLFFSPDGKIVAKEIGFKSTDEFIKLATNAIDTAKQYFRMLSNYEAGKKDYSSMAYLAITASEMGDRDIAATIAKDYKLNYLDKLDEKDINTSEILNFIGRFPDLINSNDKFFDLFYLHPGRADSTMRFNGASDSYVRHTIKREEVDNRLWTGSKPVSKHPNWGTIELNILKKYPKVNAKEFVLNQQMLYYKQIGDWQQYANAVDLKISKYPPTKIGGYPSDTWDLNSEAWDIFLNCADKAVLRRALAWSELSIKLEQPNPDIQFFDTRANLLYKLGRIKEAIKREEEAIQISIENARKNGVSDLDKGSFYNDYTANLEKMKKGKPTWDTK